MIVGRSDRDSKGMCALIIGKQGLIMVSMEMGCGTMHIPLVVLLGSNTIQRKGPARCHWIGRERGEKGKGSSFMSGFRQIRGRNILIGRFMNGNRIEGCYFLLLYCY